MIQGRTRAGRLSSGRIARRPDRQMLSRPAPVTPPRSAVQQNVHAAAHHGLSRRRYYLRPRFLAGACALGILWIAFDWISVAAPKRATRASHRPNRERMHRQPVTRRPASVPSPTSFRRSGRPRCAGAGSTLPAGAARGPSRASIFRSKMESAPAMSVNSASARSASTATRSFRVRAVWRCRMLRIGSRIARCRPARSPHGRVVS